MTNLVVAVTDNDWFRTLTELPELNEVNFWSPSTVNFRALKPGELFLFKLHAPINMIVGGGVFLHATNLPMSFAWETFGDTNGARSLEELRQRITRLGRQNTNSASDFQIGCRILTQPFFFEEDDWMDSPLDWSPNIVSFKTYDAAKGIGLDLWEAVHERLGRQAARQDVSLVADTPARYGQPQLIQPRLGQGAFRVRVTDAYDRRCAVTRERTLPALDAAHIRPYSEGGEHATTNGLLLRKDIHRLFDLGYVTVTPSLEFAVSSRIKEEFENGHEYYDYGGSKILVPKEPENHPNPDALMWHNENVFKG